MLADRYPFEFGVPALYSRLQVRVKQMIGLGAPCNHGDITEPTDSHSRLKIATQPFLDRTFEQIADSRPNVNIDLMKSRTRLRQKVLDRKCWWLWP